MAKACPTETPSSNVARIAKLEADALGGRSLGARCATGLIRFAGTTAFAAIHLMWFVGWLAMNTGLVPGDPAVRSLSVQLPHARRLARGDLPVDLDLDRSERDGAPGGPACAPRFFQINMLAEQESTAAIRMLQRIGERAWASGTEETVDMALAEETDVERIVTAIDRTVPS